jgi:hypothetical protein
MKNRPKTAKEWIAYILVMLILQPSMMYLGLRVLHWNFFLSAFLAGAFAAGVGQWLVSRWFKERPLREAVAPAERH